MFTSLVLLTVFFDSHYPWFDLFWYWVHANICAVSIITEVILTVKVLELDISIFKNNIIPPS